MRSNYPKVLKMRIGIHLVYIIEFQHIFVLLNSPSIKGFLLKKKLVDNILIERKVYFKLMWLVN